MALTFVDHPSPDYASLPAAALGVRPRLASERSRIPREQPITHYSSQQYDHDFPPFTNATVVPPNTHKGEGKGKLSDRPALHIPGKNKGKGKFTPKGSEKASEKDSDQGSEKGSVKGFGKGAAKGKGKGKGKGKSHK